MNKGKEMTIRVDELMKEWATYCHSQAQWKNSVFVEDGPFPHYFSQKKKILFIGREIPGKKPDQGLVINYINERMDMPNLGAFQSLLLYLAYGILNEQYNYEQWIKMDNAKKLNALFAEDAKGIDDAFSYAFMNASKILNTESTYVKDGGPFRQFTADKVNRELFIREIELLEPDIIVSGNLNEFSFYLHEEFNDIISKDSGGFTNENCYVWKYKLKANGKTIPCLDGWHFSAHKPHFECFYQPICEAAKFLLRNDQSAEHIE